MVAGGLGGSRMSRIGILTLAKLAAATAVLRAPLRALEAAPGTTASGGELATPERARPAPVASTVRPRTVLGRRSIWRIRRRVRLAGVVKRLRASGRPVVVVRIRRGILANAM